MPPFLYGLHNNTYYNPEPDTEDTLKWTYGPQPVPHPTEEQAWGWTKFGLGLAAVAGFGRVRFSSEKRGWDYLIGAVRGIEEYSPGRVFRTFQVSHLLSPLETAARQTRYIGPEEIARLRGGPSSIWLDHLERLGVDLGKVGQEGFRFEKGQILRGRTGSEVLLERAGIVRSPTGAGARFQEAYARSLAGGPLPGQEKAFAQAVRFTDEAGRLQKDIFMFTGGRGRLQSAGRYLAGYGTTLVERINQLARAPFELPVISGITQKLPFVNRLRLDVVPSSGLRTFGKIVSKLGIRSSLWWTLYKGLDYHIREEEALDETILAEGLTAGIATAWTRGQVATSRVAEMLGLHAYREAQEEIAPGSTELSKLLAFPLLGALGGLFTGYAQNIRRLRGYRKAGLDLGTASRALQAEESFMREFIHKTTMDDALKTSLDEKVLQLARERATERVAGWQGGVSKWFAQKQGKRTIGGAFTRLFNKVVPGRVTWMTGAAIGAALISPFIPGALIPSERPEELEAIYSGEQKIAVRRGRYWEFGRSPYEGQRIDRYRVHWYPRMLARAKEKAIWGEDAPSPLKRWWIENMTYELERRHYHERPYPITGAAFEDIPFIGPLIAATVGRAFKPPTLMHTEEWMRGPGTEESVSLVEDAEYRRMPLKYGEKIIPGELEPGAPITPYGAKGTVGEQIYRMTEMVGLPGFTMTAIKEAITGEADTFAQEMQLESARRMYGCLTEETGVVTGSDGQIKKISNIVPGDFVYTHSGLKAQVECIIKKDKDVVPGKGKTICLKSFGSCNYLKTTPDHQLFVYPGRWKPAGEIKKGEYLSIPKLKFDNSIIFDISKFIEPDLSNCSNSFIYPKASREFIEAYELWEQTNNLCAIRNNDLRSRVRKSINKGNIYRIPRQILLDQEFGYFVGLYLAEGNFKYQRSNGRLCGIQLTLHTKELSFINRLEKRLEGYISNITTRVDKDRPNTLVVFISGRVFAEFIKKLLGEKDNKHIPIDVCQDASKSFSYGVIEGLIDGDGHISPKENTVSFSSTRQQLSFGLKWLVISVGLGCPSIYHTEAFQSQIRNNSEKWTVKASGITSFRIRTQFGWQVIKRRRCERKNWLEDDNFIWVKVTNRITEDHNYFYDIILDHDDHSFLTTTCSVHNSEREYWDLELGGGLGTTELLRRLYPHRRRQIPLYNPIPNLMPEWLPGPGEKSPDFLHGDPFSKVAEGEMRLPGPGYAALHPELRGVAPEDYPLIHRFSILADVAPYSDKFKSSLTEIRSAIARKELSQEEIALYKETMEQLKARRTRREFTPYKYRERARTPIEEILAAANEREKDRDSSDSWFARAVGSYWETLAHNAETPVEYLTPMSPASKLIHMRTAVEDYERSVWATENAFWGHPIRDFILPTITATAHALGWDSIPSHVQERRDLEEYFDILKYVKYTRLKNTAKVSGDQETIQEYENKRRETLFGINPYTYNFSHIFRALPRRDRDYFNEFVKADTEERKEILSMIPENERALFIARWKLKDAADLKKAIKKDLLTDEQVEQSEVLLRQLYQEKDTEGYPKDKELWAEYIATRYSGESYADWYRRVKLLPEELEGRALPGPDWVGWSPMVDLEDIKLKIVTQESKNMYDYDLWPDRLRNVARRPMIAEAAKELEEPLEGSEEIRARIDAILAANNIRPTAVYLTKMDNLGENIVELELEEDRFESSRAMIRRYAHG